MHLTDLSKKDNFIKDIFGCYQLPLETILQNKLLISKHYGFTEYDLDNQVYFLFEEYIKIINKLVEEENKKQKEENNQNESKQTGGFNPSKIMSGMSGMMSKFRKK